MGWWNEPGESPRRKAAYLRGLRRTGRIGLAAEAAGVVLSIPARGTAGACEAPITRWEGASADDDGDGDPESASYECGLALIYDRGDADPTRPTRLCRRAYDVAVKLRREAS